MAGEDDALDSRFDRPVAPELVGIGVGVLHVFTITYVAHVVSRKSALYGAIGIAVALLLWTYFAGRLLTASIAANAALRKRRSEESPEAPQ